MASRGDSRGTKIKILCLHGIGTNSEILEAQTALRYQLGNDYEYDFIDGEYPWLAARGICEVFGDRQICYSYFDGTAKSVTKAVDDLATYVRSHGPFHAIMGFSLGAALAATLLLHSEKQQTQLPIKCAIFLCGTLPCDWQELESGHLRLLQAEDVRHTIQVPTVHAWSSNDVDHPGQSAQLAQMCEATRRVEVLHSTGHSVPSQGTELVALARAIQQTITNLQQ